MSARRKAGRLRSLCSSRSNAATQASSGAEKLRAMIQSAYRRRSREWESDDDEVLNYAETTAAHVEGVE